MGWRQASSLLPKADRRDGSQVQREKGKGERGNAYGYFLSSIYIPPEKLSEEGRSDSLLSRGEGAGMLSRLGDNASEEDRLPNISGSIRSAEKLVEPTLASDENDVGEV